MSAIYALCKKREAENTSQVAENTIIPIPRVNMLKTIPMLPSAELLTNRLPKPKYTRNPTGFRFPKKPRPVSLEEKPIFVRGSVAQARLGALAAVQE